MKLKNSSGSVCPYADACVSVRLSYLSLWLSSGNNFLCRRGFVSRAGRDDCLDLPSDPAIPPFARRVVHGPAGMDSHSSFSGYGLGPD